MSIITLNQYVSDDGSIKSITVQSRVSLCAQVRICGPILTSISEAKDEDELQSTAKLHYRSKPPPETLDRYNLV